MSAIWSARGTDEYAQDDLGIDIEPLDTVALDVTMWDEDERVELSIDRDEATGLRDALTTWLGDGPQSGNPA